MKTCPFQPKHIAFIQINNPPSLYNLKQAEIAAQKKSRNPTIVRWKVEDEEKKSLLNYYNEFKTVYISINEFKVRANPKENELISISYPALAQLGTDREKIKRFAGAPQFCFGGYYYQDKLFLLDDIIEWSYHRISWSEIRTAKSIVESLRKNG